MRVQSPLAKSVYAIYLVPENYEKRDDENGYTVIVKKGAEAAGAPEDDPGEIPF